MCVYMCVYMYIYNLYLFLVNSYPDHGASSAAHKILTGFCYPLYFDDNSVYSCHSPCVPPNIREAEDYVKWEFNQKEYRVR